MKQATEKNERLEGRVVQLERTGGVWNLRVSVAFLDILANAGIDIKA